MLRRFRKLMAMGALAMSAAFTAPAHAGIPTADIPAVIQRVLSLLQQVQEVENQIQQIAQLGQQVEQMGQQLESINGLRDLANFANNPLLRDYLPADTLVQLNQIRSGGYEALNGYAKQLRDAQMLYNCLDVGDAGTRSRCQANFALPYQEKANYTTALQTAAARSNQIQQLMQSAATAADPKAIAEAQARLQGETAMITQEQTRATLMVGLAASEQKIAESQRVERAKANVTRTGNLADFFE